jgi:two-component system, sensor histidine kinase LadS
MGACARQAFSPKLCRMGRGALWARGWLVSLALALLCADGRADHHEIEIRSLSAEIGAPSADAVTSGALDARFEPYDFRKVRRRNAEFWLRLTLPHLSRDDASGAATLNVLKGRHLDVRLYAADRDPQTPLRLATALPTFRGMHEAVFLLPDAPGAGDVVYAHVSPAGEGSEQLRFELGDLDSALSEAAGHARMIALTFGALMAMALAAFLIWFVLSDRLLLLYGSLFTLQAIYMAYLSGQGFDWPGLSAALPLASDAWNVPAALSGGIACLFVREIAELNRFSPRVYRAFGWLAGIFVILAIANLGRHIGLGAVVVMLGNIVFVFAAGFTLVAAFMAWRRENRAAGWFLIAWGLLETFTIATAIRLLVSGSDDAAGLLYYGLPMSMVAAAVLIALGVADRLRDERIALTDAQRRAQTDPLTGVLNRRSLIERLDAACLRAQARGLPIALLFIDLDHFKQINDTYGHAAGDACLRAVIEPIHAELRQSDVIGRYGGEEFVVILSSADRAAAEPIAERIRNRVADVTVEGFGPPIHVTCSIGVATSDMLGVWGEKLIARADEAVYVAKRSGRNRVQIAAPLAA